VWARVRVVPGNRFDHHQTAAPVTNYLNYNPSYLAAVKAPLDTLALPAPTNLAGERQGGGITRAKAECDPKSKGAARALCDPLA